MNKLIGEFPSRAVDLIVKDQKEGFRKELIILLFQVLGISLCIALKLLFCDRLAATYRNNIDRHIHQVYMRENSLYDLLINDAQIDNPASRITQDVSDYTQELFLIISKIIQTPIIIVYYGISTYKITNFYSIFCLCFAVISVVVSNFAMKPIVRLTYLFQSKNDDFRFAHVSLKENAETICLSGAQSKEYCMISDRLRTALNVQRKLANVSIPLNFLMNIFAYFGSGVVYLCICFYVSRNLQSFTEKALSSFIFLASFHIIMLIFGFTSIFNMMKDFSKLSGYATRINELWTILSDYKHKVESGSITSDFVMTNVDICAPSGKLLLRDLSLRISPHDSLIIIGPSGCGKSSIFRVFGKLWPVHVGSVSTVFPE